MCRLIKDLQSLRYIRMCFVSGPKHLVIQQMFTDRTRARTGRGPFDVQDSEDVDVSWSTGRKSVYFVDDENTALNYVDTALNWKRSFVNWLQYRAVQKAS